MTLKLNIKKKKDHDLFIQKQVISYYISFVFFFFVFIFVLKKLDWLKQQQQQKLGSLLIHSLTHSLTHTCHLHVNISFINDFGANYHLKKKECDLL